MASPLYSCAFDPPPPLIKAASNARPCSKLGGTTLNERERGGQYYIPQTCDQQRFEGRKIYILFSRPTVSKTFLQLVVAPKATSLLKNFMDTLHLTELNTVTFQLPHLNESRKLPETSDDLRRLSYLS